MMGNTGLFQDSHPWTEPLEGMRDFDADRLVTKVPSAPQNILRSLLPLDYNQLFETEAVLSLAGCDNAANANRSLINST